VGTAYVAIERVPTISWIAATAVGLPITALLVVNNLRDIPTDREVGKQTLAVRLGDRRTRLFYALLIAGAFLAAAVAALSSPWSLLAFGAVVVARKPVATVLKGASGRALIPVLGDTGKMQLVFGALLSVGLVVAKSSS
jgi:1,4-dihydroxy-2-naphthoate polyprenyltransferase